MAMTYPQAREAIAGFSHTGARVRDLSRIRALLGSMGDPQGCLRFIHIAGTNGKGSVATMLAEVLAQAGYQTGKFTSPYILDFCDRIQLNGQNIPRDTLAVLTEEVLAHAAPLALRGMDFSQFEIIMAIALAYYAQAGAQAICLEAGIGGRLDSTNVIPPPLCSIITSISFDHTAILGDTLEEISAQKAGIIKPGSPAVVSPGQAAQALASIMEVCALTGSPLHMPSLAAVITEAADVYGTAFSFAGEHYRLAMPGRHQIANALTVIEAVQVLRGKGFAISQRALAGGLAKARIPARGEVIGERPLVILDGAHNPGGMQTAADLLCLSNQSPRIAMVGMLADKQAEEALGALAGHIDAAVCVDGYSERELSAQALAKMFAAMGVPAHTANAQTGLALAKSLAGEGGVVLVAGSLYLATVVENRKT